MSPASRGPLSASQIAEKRQAYFASLPPEPRRVVKQIRTLIRELLPDAVEAFSYGIPGFRFVGCPLIWYAGYPRHVSLYPIGAGIRRRFAADLSSYKVSTGTVRFPLDRPLPVPLVKRLVRARVEEVMKPRGR